MDPLRQALEDALRRRSDVHLAVLFGSVARGRATDASDVDVAIVARSSSSIDRLALARDLTLACGREVDVVDLETASIPLLAAIVRDGVPLHQARPGAFASWRSRALASLELDLPWYRRMRDAWLARAAGRP